MPKSPTLTQSRPVRHHHSAKAGRRAPGKRTYGWQKQADLKNGRSKLVRRWRQTYRKAIIVVADSLTSMLGRTTSFYVSCQASSRDWRQHLSAESAPWENPLNCGSLSLSPQATRYRRRDV